MSIPVDCKTEYLPMNSNTAHFFTNNKNTFPKKIFRKAYTRWQVIVHFLVFWFAFFIFKLGRWINGYFGDVTFDQVMFHIQLGPQGLVEGDKKLFFSFIRFCVLGPMAMALLLTIVVIAINFLLIKLPPPLPQIGGHLQTGPEFFSISFCLSS